MRRLKWVLLACLLLAAGLIGYMIWQGPSGVATAAPPPPFEYQGLLQAEKIAAYEKEAQDRLAESGAAADVKAAAWNNLAVCSYLRGDYAKADEQIDKALAENSEATYQINKAVICRRLAASESDPDKRIAQARKAYEAVLAKQDKNGLAHNNLGWLLVQEAMKKTGDDPARATLLADARKHFESASSPQANELVRAGQVNLIAVQLLLGEVNAGDQKAALTASCDDQRPWTRQAALMNLGELARAGGDWQSAADYYRHAYELGRDGQLPPPALSAQPAPRAKENPWILQRLGLATFVLGKDDAQSASHLRTAAEKFGAKQVVARYAALIAAVADARQAGQEAIAADGLPERADQWVDALWLFMADKMDEQKLAEAAADRQPAAQKAKQLEMQFFVGLKRLLEGDKASARQALKQCDQLGGPLQLEASMARGILKGLGED